MKTVSVAMLSDLLRAGVGESGVRDLMYEWIEEGISLIRDREWPWNWTKTNKITYEVLTEPQGATWFVGDPFIETPFSVTLGTEVTGRYVKLGDEYYRVIDVGLINAHRYYMDRPIVSAGTLVTDLEFVRVESVFKTTRIRNVSAGNTTKVPRYDLDVDFYGSLHGADFERLDPGTPAAYLDNDSVMLEPPAYPPVYGSSGAGAFTNGDYYYFYVKYDSESGLESAPGPMLKVSITDTFRPIIKYGNPAPIDQLETTTYKLRLYRSEVNPERERCPMYLRETRNAEAPLGSFVDLDEGNGLLYNAIRYWDGPYVAIRLLPAANEVLSFTVDHLNNWYYRPNDRDQIACGVDNQLIELLRIHVAGLAALAGRTPNEYRAAVVQFRQQLNYLLTKAKKSGANDVGPSTHEPVSYGWNEDTSGTWIDGLPSPWGNS